MKGEVSAFNIGQVYHNEFFLHTVFISDVIIGHWRVLNLIKTTNYGDMLKMAGVTKQTSKEGDEIESDGTNHEAKKNHIGY